MKPCFLLAMLMFVGPAGRLFGQVGTQDEVKIVISQLFSAMLRSDSASVTESFWPDAILQTISTTSNQLAQVKSQSIEGFAKAVGNAKPGSLNEQIDFGAIHIDADLASVWTPYRFFLDGKFNHAGANSFQLVRKNGVWKIQYLIDTRRRESS